MFNVHLRNKDMRFEFRHITTANQSKFADVQEPTKDITHCYLYTDKKETKIPILETHVVRKNTDRFVKFLANKAALTKLLSISDFSKLERSAIWKAFFDTRHGKTR
jgi:hypothetical protein